ncbi:MAG: MBL fold metallo-hydrolase [Christensenellaceae bacterium]
MKAEKIYPIGFAANSYILTEDGKNAVVVDPAQPRIEDELEKRGLRPAFVLLTHAHFDHVGGVSALQKRGRGCCARKGKKRLSARPPTCPKNSARRVRNLLWTVF